MIRKQKNEIDQLEREKKELHKDLRLAESRSNQVADEGNADRLKAIVDARGTVFKTNLKSNTLIYIMSIILKYDVSSHEIAGINLKQLFFLCKYR